MAIDANATYDKIVVHFDPISFGIQHIKAFEGDDERGIIDRETSNGAGTREGIYHPEDPDIVKVVNQFYQQRLNPNVGTLDDISLIYRFGTDNDVDATYMNLSSNPRYAFFMLMDPLHTEIRRREGTNPFVGTSGPHTHKGYLTGQVRRMEEE